MTHGGPLTRLDMSLHLTARDAANRARFRALLLASVLVVLSACGEPTTGSRAAETIDRDVFIATVVDLRLAAYEHLDGEGWEAARDSVLEHHGVEADDLVRFAEAHGTRIESMIEVWDSISRAVTTAQSDSASGR